MSRMKLFALEEEEVVDVQEVAESLTPSILEDENMLIESTDPITDGIDAVDELTEVKDVMDQSIEAGTGLDPVAAEMARISIRNILSKIGAEHYTSQMMVASESFGSTSSRLANTRYASENIGKTLGDICKRIVEFFSKLYNSFIEFLKNTFDRRKILLKRTETLLNKLKSSGDIEPNVNAKTTYPLRIASNLIATGNENVADNIINLIKIQATHIKEHFVYMTGIDNYLMNFQDNYKEAIYVDDSTGMIPREGSFYNGVKFKVEKKGKGTNVFFTESTVINEPRPSDGQNSYYPLNAIGATLVLNNIKTFFTDHLTKFESHLETLSKYIKEQLNAIKKVDKNKEDEVKYKELIKYLSSNVKVSGMIISNTHMLSEDVLKLIEKWYK